VSIQYYVLDYCDIWLSGSSLLTIRICARPIYARGALVAMLYDTITRLWIRTNANSACYPYGIG